MVEYKFKDEVDKEKVFVINRSKIGKRLDPYYSKNEYIDIINKLNKNNKTITLKKLNVIIKKGIFDISPNKYKKEGIPFLRVADLKNGTINFKNTVYISTETHKTEVKTEYEPDDLVISKVGTLGEVSILPHTYKKYNISQNVVGLKLTNETKKIISTKFLQIFFRTEIGKKQIERESAFGIQPKITLDALRNIQIPLFSLKTQQKIVDQYQKAYNQKQQKEKEAKKLLASIDAFLLNELGITLPEKDNSLESRIFNINFSEISNGRMDSTYYKKEFQELAKLFNNSKFEIYSFKNIIHSITNGFDFRDYKKSGTPYLKVANIKKGNFDFSNIQYIDFDSEEISKKIQLKKNNLLLTRKGTFGNALSLDDDYNYVISSEVFYIDLKDKIVNSKYLELFFNSSIGQIQFDRFSIGAIMGSLSQEAVNSLKVLLPPIEKQNEIAKHISSIEIKVKQLKKEATNGLEKAKQETEQLILGK